MSRTVKRCDHRPDATTNVISLSAFRSSREKASSLKALRTGQPAATTGDRVLSTNEMLAMVEACETNHDFAVALNEVNKRLRASRRGAAS
jgi:hypothetical protein